MVIQKHVLLLYFEVEHKAVFTYIAYFDFHVPKFALLSHETPSIHVFANRLKTLLSTEKLDEKLNLKNNLLPH